ncbi:MAG: YceD family protein [Myxococcota bacterium]|nr:YceD family protein [Myxococcota bacterium]
MRISADDIPARGRPVQVDLNTPWLASAAKRALEVTAKSLSMSLMVTRDDECVVVSGEGSLTLDASCDRCLAELTLSFSGPVALRYAPADPTDTGDRDLDEDDLDEGWFDGRLLDMTDVVSEQLMLWMPGRILCDSPGVERRTSGTCGQIDYDLGPEVKRASPFSGLKLPNK